MTLDRVSNSDALSKDGGIRVALVDDSSVVRNAITKILEKEPDISVVSSVVNGQLGVDAAAKHKPHIVILDIEMPVMDGLTALPKILEASPQTKVVMFSSLTEKGAAETLKALSLGAVECLAKPSSTSTEDTEEFKTRLINLVRNLVPQHATTPKPGNARRTITPPAYGAGKEIQLHSDPTAYKGKPSIIAIGSSTGGPQALFEIMKNFKGLDIPIVITQHMPATFTKMLAQHITQQAGIEAHEAEDGMEVKGGQVYVAKGGRHMLFTGAPGNVSIKLDDGPPENFCKPAVDPMFRSLLDIYGNRILAVILTGMGADGLEGAKIMVEKGARLIAQDEKTSVVWGMPGAVAAAGICTAVLPLKDIGPWVKDKL